VFFVLDVASALIALTSQPAVTQAFPREVGVGLGRFDQTNAFGAGIEENRQERHDGGRDAS